MNKRASAIGIALLIMTGCQKPAPEQKQVNVSDQPYRDRLLALSETQRNDTFGRTIRDAGLDCQWVTKSARIGDVGGRPAWRAQCMEGRDFALVLQNGGVVQVVPPKALGAAER